MQENHSTRQVEAAWQWTVERRMRFYARRTIRHRPALYLPISRLRHRPEMNFNGRPVKHTSVIDDRTNIVIEGLHRSGNTFAFVAFQLAQSRPVHVAHHLHAESQIIEGVRRNVPVMLLIRHPEDLSVSYSASFGLPMAVALKDYVTFYGRLLPYRKDIVVAPFETVTTDLASVIDQINTRYATHFTPFRHTEANVQRCFSIIREFYERTAPDPKRTIAFPSDHRQNLKKQLQAEFYSHQLRGLRAEAFRIYESYEEAGIDATPGLAVFPMRLPS